jgi:hypothetical protein
MTPAQVCLHYRLLCQFVMFHAKFVFAHLGCTLNRISRTRIDSLTLAHVHTPAPATNFHTFTRYQLRSLLRADLPLLEMYRAWLVADIAKVRTAASCTHTHSVILCCPHLQRHYRSCHSRSQLGTESMYSSNLSPSCHDSYQNAITRNSARNESSESKARIARTLRALRRPFHRRTHPHETRTAKRVCIR